MEEPSWQERTLETGHSARVEPQKAAALPKKDLRFSPAIDSKGTKMECQGKANRPEWGN